MMIGKLACVNSIENSLTACCDGSDVVKTKTKVWTFEPKAIGPDTRPYLSCVER